MYFAQAVRIIYAEDRAQMNRELWEMENWISGAEIGHGSTMRSWLPEPVIFDPSK